MSPTDRYDRLEELAADLKSGVRAHTISVREILGWFGARRRGYLVVEQIREAFKAAGVITSPDFNDVHIDAVVALVLEPVTHQAATSEPGSSERPAPHLIEAVAATIGDPTFRLGRLPSANKTVTWVPPTATVGEATTLMLTRGFSQLPVMTSVRELKGVISWKSLGQERALGRDPQYVGECMEQARELPESEAVFNALATIVAHDYVLVRAHDRQICGIVTASDLSIQFQQLAEPFLLIGEIENHIRNLLQVAVDGEDLLSVSRSIDDPAPKSVADLTFSQYHALFHRETVWLRLGVALDQSTFCKELDAVRLIRNDVMHFNPDPFDESQITTLRSFAELTRRITDQRRK